MSWPMCDDLVSLALPIDPRGSRVCVCLALGLRAGGGVRLDSFMCVYVRLRAFLWGGYM